MKKRKGGMSIKIKVCVPNSGSSFFQGKGKEKVFQRVEK